MLIKSSKKYSIDSKKANDTLMNVFAACEQEPNETPLEVIRAINIANAAIVKVCFFISIGLLVLILLSPLAFIKNDSAANRRARSEVRVENHYIDSSSECFVMVLDGYGIKYEEIYATKDDGSVIVPKYIDKNSQTVYIPFSEGNINIFIPKEDGSVMQAVLSK